MNSNAQFIMQSPAFDIDDTDVDSCGEYSLDTCVTPPPVMRTAYTVRPPIEIFHPKHTPNWNRPLIDEYLVATAPRLPFEEDMMMECSSTSRNCQRLPSSARLIPRYSFAFDEDDDDIDQPTAPIDFLMIPSLLSDECGGVDEDDEDDEDNDEELTHMCSHGSTVGTLPTFPRLVKVVPRLTMKKENTSTTATKDYKSTISLLPLSNGVKANRFGALAA